MRETRVLESAESQESKSTIQLSKSKSAFNDAEYRRWSETLSNRRNSKKS
jgi:hypothetical protein